MLNKRLFLIMLAPCASERMSSLMALEMLPCVLLRSAGPPGRPAGYARRSDAGIIKMRIVLQLWQVLCLSLGGTGD